MRPASETPAPPITRDGRVPRRPTSRPENGELSARTSAIGTRSAPVADAE